MGLSLFFYQLCHLLLSAVHSSMSDFEQTKICFNCPPAMLVDEYGGKEHTEAEDKTAKPHHHPGDRPHVNHREVGVLNRL